MSDLVPLRSYGGYGEVIYLSRDGVQSIRDWDRGKTLIGYANGETFTVQGSVESVARALKPDRAKGGSDAD